MKNKQHTKSCSRGKRMVRIPFDEFCKQKIRQIPADPYYYFLLAGEENRRGKWKEAIAMYRKGVKLDKTDYQAFNDLGMIELHNNLLPGALDHFSMAISLKPNYFSARINRAHAERRLGNPGAAVMDYDFVLEHNPLWTTIYVYRGDAKLDQHDYRGAYGDFCKAYAQDPGLEEAGLKKQMLEAEHGDLLTADAAGHPNAPRRGFGLMFNCLGRLKVSIASLFGNAVLLLLLRVGDLVPDMDDLLGLVPV